MIWSRAQSPSRLGIRFTPGATDRGWFEALLAADAVAAGAVRRVPERLPARSRVYLGEPPRYLVDFAPEELALLRRIGSGVTVEALVKSFGPGPQRAVGALFALVSRRQVVLDPTRSPGPGAWRAIFDRAEIAAAADALGRELPDRAPGRSPAAQKLYAEALDHLAAGRIGLAVARLEDAHKAAPDDQAIREELERLRPWA
ncbi:MAG: PilZ domain-containing protein [Anaeromyxobacter sp.]